jgi:hypothetical protein
METINPGKTANQFFSFGYGSKHPPVVSAERLAELEAIETKCIFQNE